MRKPVNVLTLMLAVVSALALTACGGGSSGGGEGGGTGTLSVGITDAAAEDVTEVWVRFTGVTVKPKNGGQEYFAIDPIAPDSGPGRIVDLMSLTGTAYEQLLEDQVLPAGEYNWIALEVAANTTPESMDNLWVMVDNRNIMEPMEIPSGQQSGLKLVSGFTVLANSSTNLMIDWDLKKALTMPRNGDGIWKLRPALRITDLAEYGRIEGRVSATLFENVGACSWDAVEDEGNAVYAFKVPEPDSSGEPTLADRFAAVVIDDIDGDDNVDADGKPASQDELSGEDPYATAVVKWDGVSSYSYSLDYMGIGDYKLAFTCQATDDFAETSEAIAFTELSDPVSVVDGETTVPPEFGS